MNYYCFQNINHELLVYDLNNNNCIKLSSRLNRPELALERDNSHLFLNPSGGAIPKQKNSKANNNRRVINDCE